MKIAVIGLDGMGSNALRLFSPYMPTITKISKVHKKLTIETIPPYTPPMWTSISSGVNPGKHGVMEFTKPYIQKNSIVRKPLSSNDVKFPRIWDFLPLFKKYSIVYNFPLMSPLYNSVLLNNVFITGWDSPKREYYPSSIKNLITRYFTFEPHYWFKVAKQGDRNKILEYLKKVYHELQIKIRGLRTLTKLPHDLFMIVLSETDWVQHLILHTPKSFEDYPILGDILKIIDEFVEFIIRSDYDYVFILSDHDHKTFTKIKNIYYPLLMHDIFSFIPKNGNKSKCRIPQCIHKNIIVKKILRLKLFSRIFMSTTYRFFNCKYAFTKVIPAEENIGLYIFDKEVEPEKLAELFMNELSLKLYKSSEIYWGPFVKDLPDLIFDFRSLDEKTHLGHVVDYRTIIPTNIKRDHDFGGNLFVIFKDRENSFIKTEIIKPWDIATTIHYLLTGFIPEEYDGEIILYDDKLGEPQKSPLLRDVILLKKVSRVKLSMKNNKL